MSAIARASWKITCVGTLIRATTGAARVVSVSSPVDGCPNDRRLGPYDTREEAQDALAKARERTAEQDALDRDWNDET